MDLTLVNTIIYLILIVLLLVRTVLDRRADKARGKFLEELQALNDERDRQDERLAKIYKNHHVVIQEIIDQVESRSSDQEET